LRIGIDTLVDAVRVHDDSACGGLPEHLGQAHHRDGSAGDHVSQDLAGADRRQLIDIADDEQGRLVRDRFDQRIHQQHVDHRGLVDNQQIAVEWVGVVAPEAAALGIDFEEAVDGLGLQAGGLVHALGGAAGGRAGALLSGGYEASVVKAAPDGGRGGLAGAGWLTPTAETIAWN
jgi:hypothetical protein